jgi:hypothetical protein
MLREGIIVDAAIMSTKIKSGERDPEIQQKKKAISGISP